MSHDLKVEVESLILDLGNMNVLMRSSAVTKRTAERILNRLCSVIVFSTAGFRGSRPNFAPQLGM